MLWVEGVRKAALRYGIFLEICRITDVGGGCWSSSSSKLSSLDRGAQALCWVRTWPVTCGHCGRCSRARQGMDLALQGWRRNWSSWKAPKSVRKLWAKDFSRKAPLLAQTVAVFSLWGFLVQICQGILQGGHRSFETFAVGRLLDDGFQLASLRHFQEPL